MGCGTSGQAGVHGHTARLQKQEEARQQLQSVPLEMSLGSDHWTEEAPLKETMRALKQIVMVARCGIPERELLFCDHMVGLWFCGYRLDDDKTVEQCQELCSVCSAVCTPVVWCGFQQLRAVCFLHLTSLPACPLLVLWPLNKLHCRMHKSVSRASSRPRMRLQRGSKRKKESSRRLNSRRDSSSFNLWMRTAILFQSHDN